ncbi:hypothetical protein MMC29_005961 [Sticta canariensis]|nr:hypothetical protein [Sticta canariensis]
MGVTPVTEFEPPLQRLSKPRANNSSTNLLKVTGLHREPSSPTSPHDTYVCGDETTVVNLRSGETRSRRSKCSKLRAYLYGASQETFQSCSSGEEDQEQKGLVGIARGVKGRLSRAGTGTLIPQSPSALASSTQLSNASSSKLLFLHENRPDLEESARIAIEIKEKAHADSLAAQNHVAPLVDEELHVDSVMSPIRRRSLYTPGIATRTPNDILRKPPLPETLRSQADRDYCFNLDMPQSFPLGQLAALEIGEGGRSTPSNLDYSHLGGLKLGTLRVTNGTASPAPTDINPLGMHPPKPESIDNDDFCTASEGGESRERSPSSVTNRPCVEGSRHIEDSQARCDQQINRIKSTGGRHDEPTTRAHNSSSPLKYERRPEECLEVECLSRYHSRIARNRSFAAHSNVSKPSDRALCIAQDYMQDLPDSPYSYVEPCKVERCKIGSSNLEPLALEDEADKEFSEDEGVVLLESQQPTINMWRSFINDAEARHANEGTREDAFRKLTANAASQSEYAARPISSSTASKSTNLSDDNSESHAANPKINADSGYSSAESLKSFERSAFGGSPGELVQEHSKKSQPRAPRCVSGPPDMPQSVQHGMNNNILKLSTRQDLARPLVSMIPNLETEKPVFVDHSKEIKAPVAVPRPRSLISPPSIAEARKLRKARPLSQPGPADFVTVQCVRNPSESSVPPVPVEIVLKHLERLRKFPLLEHTFPSLQHVRSNESLIDDEPISVPIRFPSPSDDLERRDSILRSNLDWPSSRSKKSKKSKSIFHRSPSRTPKSERRKSQSESLETIVDFGVLADCLGGKPYNLARSATAGSRNASSSDVLRPHQVDTSASRPRTMIGMDEEVAAEFARARSKQRSKGSSGLYVPSSGGFNDRGGIPGKLLRPQGMSVDAPPVPPLPGKEEINKRSQSVSKSFKAARTTFDNRDEIPRKLNRSQSMYIDVPAVPILPTKQQIAQREAQISKSNSIRSNTLPPPLQIKRPSDNLKNSGVAGNAETERQESTADPVADWKHCREGWNQRRTPAGDALLLRFQALRNSKTPLIPSPSSGHPVSSEYTPYTRPSSPSASDLTGPSQNTRLALKPLPQPVGTSSQHFNINRKIVATTSAASEQLIGRYAGGLSYGYEPGHGLGGSAGTRSATTSASRKSVNISGKMNDTHRQFNSIFSSPEEMRQRMINVAEYSSTRSRAKDWFSNMRVLVLEDPVERTSSSIQSLPAETGACVKGLVTSANTTASARHLRFQNRQTLANPSAYVAVSYCWNRKYVQWFTERDSPSVQIMMENSKIQSTSTPPDVLHRAIAFASAHHLNAIWIDQECIIQENPQDKGDGIQAMDIVYQESSHPVAIAEFSFQTKEEIDVFASIADPERYAFDPFKIDDLCNVLADLSTDAWFSRAWTLQESSSAGVSMMLLLGCPLGIDKPTCFGSIPGDIEISIWDFQEAMVNARNLIEEGLAADLWPDPTLAIQASNFADILWNYIPTILPKFRERDSSHRQACNAAEALSFLRDRENSFPPDRLAILANLCNYEQRIDPAVFASLKYGFSVCALTLSILNGDTSLLDGYAVDSEFASDTNGREIWVLDTARNDRALGLVFENDDQDTTSNSYGFSWGPHPSGCLSNVKYIEEHDVMFRLRPATLSSLGLMVSGVTWDMKHIIETSNTQKLFATKWEQELKAQKSDLHILSGNVRQRSLLQAFIWTLLHELIDLGFPELAKSLWHFFQPFGRGKLTDHPESEEYDSIAAPRPYSFEVVFGHSNMLRMEKAPLHSDTEEIIARITFETLSFDPQNEAFDRPSVERRLLEEVCETGKLFCGSPINCTASAEPRVWFESCKAGDIMFTPSSSIGDRAVVSRYRTQAMSWRVLKAGDHGQSCEILHCLGRRRGVWRLEGLTPADYILE